MDRKDLHQLVVPVTFKRARESDKRKICGGCGPLRWGRWIPNFCFGPACDIHDWMYAYGIDLDDKKKADRVFLINMVTLIEERVYFGPTRVPYLGLAFLYYYSVRWFGFKAFYRDKPFKPHKPDRSLLWFMLSAITATCALVGALYKLDQEGNPEKVEEQRSKPIPPHGIGSAEPGQAPSDSGLSHHPEKARE